MSHSYSQEDVQQILQLALAQQADGGEFSRDRLLEMAHELGISESTLHLAEQQWLGLQGENRDRQAFDQFRRSKFKQSAIKYAIVNSFLVVLNLLTAHTLSWVFWVAGLWGVFLALKGWKTYALEGEEYERAFSAWRLKQQIGQSLGNTLSRFLNPERESL